MEPRTFTLSKEERDACFQEKDGVTLPLLKRVRIEEPTRFYAVLMPALYGPEVFYLRERGVPGRNLFAIERDPDVHAVLRNPPKAYTHLQGLQTTQHPLALQQAIERVPFPWLNLVYFDLFGQPDASHLCALFRLFRLFPFRSGGTLLLTHGRNRGAVFACRLNARITKTTTGQAYIETALRKAGHKRPRQYAEHEYVSDKIHFNITEVLF
jgi:hypothetical protein